MPAAAAATAIGQAVNGLLNYAYNENVNKRNYSYNVDLQERQNRYNTELAEKQNQWNRENARWAYDTEFRNNVDLWNMQNEYNTPTAQMQRLRDAGLNPYMLNASGDAGNSGAVTPPDMKTPESVGYPMQGSAPTAQAMEFKFDSIVDKIYSAKIREKQLEQMDANIAKTTAETDNIVTNGRLLGLKEIYDGLRNQYAPDLFSTDIARRRTAMDKLGIETQILGKRLSDIIPKEITYLELKNRAMQQSYDFNEQINPYKVAHLRFTNAYQQLINDAKTIENKYLDTYYKGRNDIMQQSLQQQIFANQLLGFQNSIMNELTTHGVTKRALELGTKYYYYHGIMGGENPYMLRMNTFNQPMDNLFERYNKYGLDPLLKIMSTLRGGSIIPTTPQWHEREFINPATGDIYNYQRWR